VATFESSTIRGNNMSNAKRLLAAALLAGSSIAMVADPVFAAPAAPGVALQTMAPSSLEHVRWGGHWGGRGCCWGGVAGGFVAGAIIGGALAAPYYYGPGYYGGPYYYGAGPYYPAPAYGPAPGYGPAPAYYGGPAPGPGGDATAYCAQRFHSYDPRTGTYLGNDGARHPCP
jgi:hypothetical protein